ncbi:hypothetical protein [Mangrovicoccus sp. HB161399]|uniref:hypothetical protein n=1 Tax=Mangrovicoccus sp. HB161399 TaxID=2720392 RepID=UPI001554C92B|nr:hypothetical protein [Mangrovicoccus sp. HB161399]
MTGQAQDFSEDELMSFIRGTAPADLAARIAASRDRDPALAAELALMAGLGPALADEPGAGTPDGTGWARLEEAIRLEPRAANVPAAPRRQLMAWRAAAAVFLLAAVAEGAWIAGRPEPGYQTVTSGTAEHVLAVGFRPDATEAEMRTLLQSAQGRLVGGPGAAGLYRVAFADEAALDAGRDLLGAAGIVELVAEE